MALQAENMSYEQLKETVDGLTCRSISPLVLPQVPPGPFDLTCFPMTLMENVDNPGVHYFDVIGDHPGDIDYFALSSAYKLACEKKDLQFLPAPFGLRGTCPKETTIQIVILTRPDGHVSILKHLSFPDKLKPALIKKLTYGEVFKPQFMMSNPKNGRNILQYCLENLGGRIFRCYELTSQAVRKGSTKSSIPFEDKEDTEIDEGFDHILQHAPRSSCEMAQLRWQTKELRSKNSPIFGWPPALVSQALRNISSDGALARKEFHWPIPLTPKYFQKEVLQALEHIWDFDLSAFVMLGEPGSGKSPLGWSVLMAQVRHNKTRFNVEGQPCIRCTPELDFLRGEPGSILMGDFLDDTSLSMMDMKLVKAFLDVGLYESMTWARWGASKWVQNEPRAVADNTYDSDLPLPEDFIPQISFEDFFKLVRPAFKESATKTHMDAIFKRTAFFVNSPKHLYYRAAGINTSKVDRLPMPENGFLTEEGRKIYGEYKGGCKDVPQSFQEEVQKEQEWVSIMMSKKLEERAANHNQEDTRNRVRQALFQEAPRIPVSPLAVLEERHSNQMMIKKETHEREVEQVFKKARIFSRLVAQSSGGCIDLEDHDEKENENPQASTSSGASEPPMAAASIHPIPNPEWDVNSGDEEGLGHGNGLDFEE